MPPDKVVCESCGAEVPVRDAEHCARCDSRGCPDCLGAGPDPVCPDCADKPLPAHIAPMLATLSALPADERNWAFEYKWDGIRALLFWDGARMRLESRNLLDITARYPEFRDLGQRLGKSAVVLDGEIVALDKRGRPSFPLLQRRMHLSDAHVERVAREVPAWYYVFDVLYAGGRPVIDKPCAERRRILEKLGFRHPKVRIPPRFKGSKGEGKIVLRSAKAHGLEGVVAKRLDSRYEPGYRSPDWRKVKVVKAQEFVIGGWIPEKGLVTGGPRSRDAQAMRGGLAESTPSRHAQARRGGLDSRDMEADHPERVLSKMRKDLRRGKVFIDWSQNDEHKTTVCVYSLRARERPTVSTPLAWKELEVAVKKGDAGSLVFEAGDVPERVRRKGDLFAEVLTLRQTLPRPPAGEKA